MCQNKYKMETYPKDFKISENCEKLLIHEDIEKPPTN